MESDIVVAREGALARITLDRPRQINALTIEMVRDLHRALRAANESPEIAVIALDGAGERGFCAGGDVRPAASDSDALLAFLDEEYALDLALANSGTPVVSLMDGITMGGGIGLGGHVQHRVVTERSRLAMPETKIGFIPDVGGSLLLARAPGCIGEYLALTGDEFGGEDALRLGFADVLVPSDRLGAVLDGLRTGAAPASILREHARHRSDTIDDGGILAHRAWIDRAFALDTVPQILAALDADDQVEAREAADRIRAVSPAATVAALQTVRRARTLNDLAAVLRLERAVAEHLVRYGDMAEGVTARLIEKRPPVWRDATASSVTLDWLPGALAV